MFAKIDNVVISMGVVLTFCASSLAGQPHRFAGGIGTPSDPYQVGTPEQLIAIGLDPNLLDRHFILVQDIDLDPNLPDGRAFVQSVIAPDSHELGSFEGTAFTGNFGGSGHVIRNLTIRSTTGQYLALFGCIGKGGVVRDLRIEGAQVGEQSGDCHSALAAGNDGRILRCRVTARVSGRHEVGLLVGRNRGEIIDCWTSGEVVGYMGVGGLAGYNAPGVIVNSRAASTVRTTSMIGGGGGLVGFNDGGLIVGCCATGDVSATAGGSLGGLVGESGWEGIISSSYSTGNVFVELGGSYLGGLVGHLTGGGIDACYANGNVSGADKSMYLGGLAGVASGYIADSYATGRVSAGKNGEYLGGLAGYGGRQVSACFWDIETSGLLTSAGGTGLATAEMRQQTSFTAWDFDKTWTICEGKDYPRLRWENVKCDK